ncbi:hypothetical protein Hanom_Chr11g01049651 [Helianthus anomalus]
MSLISPSILSTDLAMQLGSSATASACNQSSRAFLGNHVSVRVLDIIFERRLRSVSVGIACYTI